MTTTTSTLDETIGSARDAAASALIDARPILSRSADNAWERTKVIRSELYALLERLCARRNLEALVLESEAYVHPAWVKFESWTPAQEPGITARAAMTIHILAKTYHRFAVIYKVDWEKHGKSGTVHHVYQLGEAELDRLLTFLTDPPAPGLMASQVRRILRPVQLREKWYQLWKPRNKVPTIRRDWVLVGSLGLILAGGMLVALGTQASSLSPESTFTSTVEPSSVTPVASTTVSNPPPSTITTTPRVENTTALETGTLSAASSRLDDGRFYDLKTVHAEAGESIVAMMRSTDFDTFLLLGEVSNGSFKTLATNDDSASDPSASRVEFVAPAAGDYVVLFTSYDQNGTGTYTYSIR